MCKCELGKCAYADSQLFDRKINCSIRGITVPLKRCPDFVPFVVTNENIKNKFPEINHFIEKPKDYELLYYQGDKIHNEYPLEVEEAKAIFNYIDFLENKQKEFVKYLENMLDDENDIFSVVRVKDVLQKYKSIIGVSDDKTN